MPSDGSNETTRTKPTISLSRRSRCTSSAVLRRPESKKNASTTLKKSSHHASNCNRWRVPAATALPIPTFAPDPELERLEKEFFDSDEDDPRCRRKVKRVPSTNLTQTTDKAVVTRTTRPALPKPKFQKQDPCVDSSGDDDDDDDDLLRRPVFSFRRKDEQTETTTSKDSSDLINSMPVVSESDKDREQQDDAVLCQRDTKHQESLLDESLMENGEEKRNQPDASMQRDNAVDEKDLLHCVDRCFEQASSADSTLMNVTVKDIVSNVEKELNQTISRTQRNSVKSHLTVLVKAAAAKTQEPRQPTLETLQQAVNHAFSSIGDRKSFTPKEMERKLQNKFGVTFDKNSKKMIKEYTDQMQKVRSKQPELADPDAHPSEESTVKARVEVARPSLERKAGVSNGDEVKAKKIDCAQKKVSTVPLQPATWEKEIKNEHKNETSKTTVAAPPAAAKPKGRRRLLERDCKKFSVEPAPKRPPSKRARKRGRSYCQLCSNCPCTFTNKSEEASLVGLSHSDGSIEKALVRRLLKLEQTTERYEDQTDAVRRKLKRHRRDIWRKNEAIESARNQNKMVQSRFLPDAHELDDQFDARKNASRFAAPVVAKAQKAVFNSVPNGQPTLTQMLGGTKKDKENQNTLDSNSNTVLETEGPLSKTADNAETTKEEFVVQTQEDSSALASDGHEDIVECNSDDSISWDTESTGEQESEQEPVVASRIDWSRGKPRQNKDERKISIWANFLAGRFDCEWDKLFDENNDGDDDESLEPDPSVGMDHLLGLLDQVEAIQSEADKPPTPGPSPVRLSMLSQRGKAIAGSIFSRIDTDSGKALVLDGACPRWRENVAFALHQRDGDNIREALEGVQQTKAKLRRAKEAVLKAFNSQEAVLGLFEDSLSQSLSRLGGESSNGDAEEQEGLFLSQAPQSPNLQPEHASTRVLPGSSTPCRIEADPSSVTSSADPVLWT